MSIPITLPDGRTLTYLALGAPAGPAVVVLDGPGSRGLGRAADAAARTLGLRLVVPDRPGAGGSDALPGRTIAGWAADHAALLDALGLERAGLLGQSGGTPYALAAAAALPARTTGLALLGAVAPFEDPATLAEASRQLRTSVALGRRAPWLLRAGLRLAARSAAKDPEKPARRFAKDLPPADLAVLEDPALWQVHVTATAEILARPDAVADEIVLLGRPWDVDLGAITAPAALWSGAADTTHPTSISRRLATLLGGPPVTVVPEAATFGLLPVYPDALRHAAGAA